MLRTKARFFRAIPIFVSAHGEQLAEDKKAQKQHRRRVGAAEVAAATALFILSIFCSLCGLVVRWGAAFSLRALTASSF
jgi:hypothetical protein